jgi:hypothetical protein
MDWARKFAFPAVVIAVALIVAPASAIADPTIGVPVSPTGAIGPPVEIDECTLLYSGNQVAGESAGVAMKFTNDSTLTADVINFHVAAGSESGTIRDVGKFSPGIEITHHYKEGSGHMMFAPLLSHPHLDCSVASVHFTDGSVWQASLTKTQPTASSPGGMSSAPGALSFGGIGEQYDQFVTVYNASGIVSLNQTGNCQGIVRVNTVASGRRSAALRVSPLAAGYCAITIDDGAKHAVMIPVAVTVATAAR